MNFLTPVTPFPIKAVVLRYKNYSCIQVIYDWDACCITVEVATVAELLRGFETKKQNFNKNDLLCLSENNENG